MATRLTTEYTHHSKRSDNDGYTCDRTDKRTNHIFWEGTRYIEGTDRCPHCSDWTVASRLHDLNEKRKAEEQA